MTRREEIDREVTSKTITQKDITSRQKIEKLKSSGEKERRINIKTEQNK